MIAVLKWNISQGHKVKGHKTTNLKIRHLLINKIVVF